MKIKTFILGIIVALLISTTVFGLPGVKKWKLTWTANTETDLAGYYLYWKSGVQAFDNARRVDVGKVITYNLDTIPVNNDLALTAYDTSGNESLFSDSIFFEKDMVAPVKVNGLAITAQ